MGLNDGVECECRGFKCHSVESPLAQHPGRLPGTAGYPQTELCPTLPGEQALSLGLPSATDQRPVRECIAVTRSSSAH